MAQRVFLIQMPTPTLDCVAAAILGTPTQRREIAAELANEGAAHLRKVTASEMVAAACEAGVVSEAWGYARNCMPYLLAATRAEQMCASLHVLEGLHSDGDVEEFFLQQAKALGGRPEKLDRHKYLPPPQASVETWILEMLERASQLRVKALAVGSSNDDGDNPVNDYAISTWVWLGRLFARTRPAFWQGRNRWLGSAAFPEVFKIHTNVTTIGPPPSKAAPESPPLSERIRGWFGMAPSNEVENALDPALAQIVATTQATTRQQSAKQSAPALRDIIESTATLLPSLAVANWEKSLPKAGEGNCVTGAVRNSRLDDLVVAARYLQSTNTIPYETGAEWIEIVIAAAMEAKRAGSHLVEGDDSIYAAYRWPAVDESS